MLSMSCKVLADQPSNLRQCMLTDTSCGVPKFQVNLLTKSVVDTCSFEKVLFISDISQVKVGAANGKDGIGWNG